MVHPPGVTDRRSGEHWAGRMYMRAVSLRWTRHLVGTGVTPNQLTYLMILAGLVAGAALLLPGVVGALAAAVLIQLYLLLDCVDGEVARWRGTTSVTGVYLDRVGHYLVEAALLVGLGLRAADVTGGDPDWLWAFLGTTAALGAILIKAETDLVDVARSRSGLPAASADSAAPRSARLAMARRAAGALRFHRLVGAVEASLVILLAAVADAVAGDDGSGLVATRLAVVVLLTVALLQAVLHLVSVLASSRLR